MKKTILNGLEYLEENYRPSDIQKLLDNSKTKREVYQELQVSEYCLVSPSKLSRPELEGVSCYKWLTKSIRKCYN